MTECSKGDEYKDAVSGLINGRSSYRQSELHAKTAERFLRLAAPQPGEHVLSIPRGIPYAPLVISPVGGD